MDKHIILGIHICDRLKRVPDVQALLSEYGANIKTRLGLHEPDGPTAPNGLLILEMWGEEARCLALGDELNKIDGIEVQRMIFTH